MPHYKAFAACSSHIHMGINFVAGDSKRPVLVTVVDSPTYTCECGKKAKYYVRERPVEG